MSYCAEEYAADTLLRDDGAPCLEVGLVEFRVDLTAAFDEIKRSDGGVCRTAGYGDRVSIGQGNCWVAESRYQ